MLAISTSLFADRKLNPPGPTPQFDLVRFLGTGARTKRDNFTGLTSGKDATARSVENLVRKDSFELANSIAQDADGIFQFDDATNSLEVETFRRESLNFAELHDVTH
jgi:hypothetical protein